MLSADIKHDERESMLDLYMRHAAGRNGEDRGGCMIEGFAIGLSTGQGLQVALNLWRVLKGSLWLRNGLYASVDASNRLQS